MELASAFATLADVIDDHRSPDSKRGKGSKKSRESSNALRKKRRQSAHEMDVIDATASELKCAALKRLASSHCERIALIATPSIEAVANDALRLFREPTAPPSRFDAVEGKLILSERDLHRARRKGKRGVDADEAGALYVTRVREIYAAQRDFSSTQEAAIFATVTARHGELLQIFVEHLSHSHTAIDAVDRAQRALHSVQKATRRALVATSRDHVAALATTAYDVRRRG